MKVRYELFAGVIVFLVGLLILYLVGRVLYSIISFVLASPEIAGLILVLIFIVGAGAVFLSFRQVEKGNAVEDKEGTNDES